MTDHEPPWWLAAVLTYPCPTCGAVPNQECRTTSGTIAHPPHVARGADRRRCKVCHVLLAKDQDVAQVLCDRCALVRSLELERATVHQRQDDDDD